MCRTRFVAVLTLLLCASVSLGAKKSKKADAPRAEQKRQDPNAAPLRPGDAQWTIYCQAVAGPDHVARANAYKQYLVDTFRMTDWYVIHQEDQSVIYYGFYRAISDAKAKADRKAVDDLKDQSGNKLLGACMFVEVSAPDPSAPPQWDLRNAQGYWTVEIAMYKEHPQRKQAAVDAVRAARDQGIEAYYYHGPTASSVCIGAWPREAVREQETAEEYNSDPTQDLLVLPQPVSDDAEFRNREGRRIKALAPRVDAVDPSLIATFAKYPTHAVNGEVFVQQLNGKNVESPSKLVRIPTPTTPSILRQNQPPPALVTPLTPSQTPGAGKLKSIGQ
jgi:hypothetical protein